MSELHQGRCHCGAIEIAYRSAVPPEATEVRACQCSFCRKHGARAVSDPAGEVVIRERKAGSLSRYRFGLRSADYLLCAHCGVYLGALMSEGEGSCAVVVLNVLEDSARFIGAAKPVDFDGEEEAERLARRRRNWTPAVLQPPGRKVSSSAASPSR